MKEEKEVWKPIRNYEGLYEVSNMGRVKSLERTVWVNGGSYKKSERILKPQKVRGYLGVSLCKDAELKRYLVHRLVGQAFMENPEGFKEINHIDEDKTNNKVENLEWCNRSYNANFGTRNQRVAEKLRGRKKSKESVEKRVEKMRGRKQSEEHIKKRVQKNSKPVYSINKESGLIVYWNSAKEAGRVLGIDNSSITKCCKGKLKSIKGYTFFYADDDAE